MYQFGSGSRVILSILTEKIKNNIREKQIILKKNNFLLKTVYFLKTTKTNVTLRNFYQGCVSGSAWIRIYLSTKNRNNARKLLKFINFLKVNLHKLHCCSLRKLFMIFSSNLVKLDRDLDPDPHKMNADPQS